MTNQFLQALKQTIRFSQEPPTIDEALDSPYYLKNVFPDIYPFWRKKLRELYPDNITTKSTYVIFHGCIGGGKSTIAQAIILYDLIKMACAEDFEDFAGVMCQNGIYTLCANVSKDAASKFLAPIINAIWGGKSPFFQNEISKGNKFLSKMHVEPIGLRKKDIVSKDVTSFWLSELNELTPEKALELISAVDSRLTSRFPKVENIFTHVIVDSSTKGTDAATEALLRSDPKFSSDKAFVVHTNSWSTHEGRGLFFNYGSFEVYSGDGQTNPFIVDLDFPPEKRRELDPDRFITCPNELRPEAERNMVLFLQEKCGIASNSTSKFFTDLKTLDQAFKIEQQSDDVIVVDFFDPLDTLMEKVKKDIITLPIDRKVYIKLDLALTGDLCGLAVAYADGITTNYIDGIDSSRLNIKIPLCVGLSRKNGQETPISKIEDFILQLNQVRTVAMVLTDQFQSSGTRQLMIQNGIDAKLQSVDRTDSAYVTLKNYIYQGLVSLPINERLRTEAHQIERVSPTKIDHPVNGSKDLLDCCAGLVEFMVSEGVEKVLEPPETQISEDISNIYDQLSKTRSNANLQRAAVADYFSSLNNM